MSNKKKNQTLSVPVLSAVTNATGTIVTSNPTVVSVCLSVSPGTKIDDDPISIDGVYIHAAELKALGIRVGQLILCHLQPHPTSSSSISLLLRGWTHRSCTRVVAVLHKTWTPNFHITPKLREISLAPAHDRMTCRPASSLDLSIEDASSSSTLSSSTASGLTLMIAHYLLGVHLQVGLRLALSWLGKSLTLRVVSITSSPSSPSSSSSSSSSIMYTVNSKTSIHLSPSSSLTSSEVTSNIPSMLDINQAAASIGLSFGGYSQQALELLSILSHPQFPPPRAVLLHGPPGTGKSLLMRLAAASLNCKVLSANCALIAKCADPDTAFVSILEQASLFSPCVICIDDLHLLCPARSPPSSSSLVALLLPLLDSHSHSSFSRPIIIATSSSPSSIDPALRRHGRIDKDIELTVPSAADRRSILSVLLSLMHIRIITEKDNDDEDNDDGVQSRSIDRVAASAHGMVAADLLVVCREAVHISRSSTLIDTTTLTQRLLKMSVSETSCASSIFVRATDLETAALRVTPSALAEVAVTIPHTRWTDIGGMSDVKQTLREVVEWPLLFPHFFESMKLPPPRGVLLYGPPGCSKTLMAKALATESSMNFLSVRGPELLSKYLGESEKAIQTLFRRARAASPCIIFFDEIDAMAGKRGTQSSGVGDRVLSQLLSELDGAHSLQRVVIVAATNRPDMLDPALLRPGRIDRKIYVGPPDALSRRYIAMNELSKVPHEQSVMQEDWLKDIINKTEGFSGAEVVALFSEAAMLAIDEECPELLKRHLEEAIGKIIPQINSGMIAFYENIRDAFIH